jgi:hypothetical protein
MLAARKALVIAPSPLAGEGKKIFPRTTIDEAFSRRKSGLSDLRTKRRDPGKPGARGRGHSNDGRP